MNVVRCPSCGGRMKRNGTTSAGSTRWRCKACGAHPWRFVRCEWEPEARRLLVFEEHTANKMGPEDTGQIVLESLTYADEPGEEPYFHDELIWCDDTPDGKVQMNTYRRDLGIRARPARKGRMRKLSYEWLANLREIVIDSERCRSPSPSSSTRSTCATGMATG